MNDSPKPDCPFCQLPRDRVIEHNDLAVALTDVFPVSPGHTLVVPRRHVTDFFNVSPGEVAAIFNLLFRVRERIVAEHDPAGFNVGINVGATAGQTVLHVHVHLIPRYSGDVLDPTGGVRNVIPGKGKYAGS
jgi:diadenosine tetraphosphate (Ap4A) HIT family hydrolase